MGGVNDVLETMSAGVAMFINGDAGDISPGEDNMFCCPVICTFGIYFNRTVNKFV